MSKLKYHVAMLFVLLLAGAGIAKAQSADAYFGVGTAQDSSAGAVINPFTEETVSAPRLSGAFGGFGGDFMVKPVIGVGFEYSARFSQGNYAGFNYRPKFYDFNAVILPLTSAPKVAPELQFGLGGASISWYYPPQCSEFVCTSSSFITSSNHFQVHLGAGVRIYVKGGIYVKPAIDVHYVNNFDQFGSNWAPEESVSIGYTFGRH